MSPTAAINAGARRLPTWVLYVIGVLPPVWFFYLGVTGQLGVDPVKAMEHRIGLLGLQLLLATLAITPLRRFTGVNLIRFRRALGLITFYYIACHLLIWLVLDVQILGQIWKDILKRPYITLGMLGFALMIPLAITSNNWSIRKLGPRWRKLHKLVYPVAILGAVHFIMVRKGFQIEPLLYMAACIILLSLRLIPRRKTR